MKLFPNPTASEVSLQYETSKEGNVHISIHDMSKEREVIVLQQYQNKGTHTVTIDISQLSRGMYFIQLEAGEELFTSKLFKE